MSRQDSSVLGSGGSNALVAAFACGSELVHDGFEEGLDGAGVSAGPMTEKEGAAGARGEEAERGGEERRGRRTEEGGAGHCSNDHNERKFRGS